MHRDALTRATVLVSEHPPGTSVKATPACAGRAASLVIRRMAIVEICGHASAQPDHGHPPCSGGLHAADVSQVAKELVEEQPEYDDEEDPEPYFYPSWERDGCRLWPVLVRPALPLQCMHEASRIARKDKRSCPHIAAI
jgi:hypothetical protein